MHGIIDHKVRKGHCTETIHRVTSTDTQPLGHDRVSGLYVRFVRRSCGNVGYRLELRKQERGLAWPVERLICP